MTDENTGGFNSSTAYVVTEGTEKSLVIGLTHVAGYEDTDYFAGQNKLYVNMISLYSDARCFSRKIGSEKRASGRQSLQASKSCSAEAVWNEQKLLSKRPGCPYVSLKAKGLMAFGQYSSRLLHPRTQKKRRQKKKSAAMLPGWKPL